MSKLKAYHLNQSRGFTLIELLVVIGIIGLLTAMVTIAGPVVYEAHRKMQTQATMRSTEIAIDQFAELDPLRGTYNSPSRHSFGRYPAYAIFNQESAYDLTTENTKFIQTVIEPDEPFPNDIQSRNKFTLRGRLARDLFSRDINSSSLNSSNRGLLSLDDDSGYEFANLQRTYDDMRALYAYLAAFVPDALEAIPPSSRLPLSENPDYAGSNAEGEYFNPTGDPDNLGGRIPILGIVDAWGVPLDYFMMFKLQYTMTNDGLVGWTVTDRRPALRSQGMKYDRLVRTFIEAETNRDINLSHKDPTEEHFGTAKGNEALRILARDRWIYSKPLPGTPMPYDTVSSKSAFVDAKTGKIKSSISGNANRFDGWVRCVAGAGNNNKISDSYGWVPALDSSAP